MTRYKNLTARLYQAGLTESEAINLGADIREFQSLETEFNGGSIPLYLLLGIKKTEPYSCDFHTGGFRGECLRNISQKSKHKEQIRV